MAKPLPTQERLRELFWYHPEGFLVRRVAVGTKYRVGQEVRGCPVGRGYRVVVVDGGQYRLHRLIYQWHHGRCPDEIDHEDHDSGNCRIWNLRDGTGGVNAANRRNPGTFRAGGQP
jgi:HNH endonuclease